MKVASSSLARNLGDGLTIYSPPVLFILLIGNKLARTSSTFFLRSGSVHSGSANWDNCGPRRVMCELFFLNDRFPHYAWTASSAHSDFVRSGVYACLTVTHHLHFWQNKRALRRATVVTQGGMDTK